VTQQPLPGGQGIVRVPIADPKTGATPPVWTRWFTDAMGRLEKGLSILGELIGPISPDAHISGRVEPIGVTVQNLTSVGKLNSLTNVAADVNLDHIADTAAFKKTSPNQVTGAGTAYTALVASAPAANKPLVFDGANWIPTDVPYASVSGAPQLPNTFGPDTHKFLISYSSGTGNFADQQPDFTDISGQITTAQLPAGLFTGTVALAKLTGLGADGSLTLVNGSVSAYTPPT